MVWDMEEARVLGSKEATDAAGVIGPVNPGAWEGGVLLPGLSALMAQSFIGRNRLLKLQKRKGRPSERKNQLCKKNLRLFKIVWLSWNKPLQGSNL